MLDAAEEHVEDQPEDIAEPAGGEEPAGQPEPAGGEDRPSKRERRAAWLAEQKRDREETRAQLARAEAERQRMAVELAELRGQVTASQQRGAGETEEQAFEKRLTDMQDKADGHLAAAANTTDEAVRKREMAAYNKLVMREIPQAIARRERDLGAQEIRQTISQGQLDPETAETRDTLASEFRWLRSNVEARTLADSLLTGMLKQGKPDSIETYRAACARAAQLLELGGTPGKGNGDSRRFTLPSGKVGAGGAGAPGRRALTEHEAVMADKLAGRQGKSFDNDEQRDAWFLKTVLKVQD